jgi:hypothetical protein
MAGGTERDVVLQKTMHTQYLLQQDRMTKVHREIIERAESLHLGPNHPPEIRMYLGVSKELPS